MAAPAQAARLNVEAAGAREKVEDIIVVGAGVAGLAAATALVDAGYRVTVLERRPFVGGRASSYEHPSLHEVIDCQHVLLGCCTNLIEVLDRVGASHAVRWYDTIAFLEPGGRQSDIAPSSLPAPFHASASFLRASMLDNRDKLGIARGMMEFLRGLPVDDSESVANWMRRSGQTERAIRHFWEPTLIVTLNDNFENCSLRYAAKVFRELFLKTSVGSSLGIPGIPLGELYSIAASHIVEKGSVVFERSGVESIKQELGGRWSITTGNKTFSANAVILATSVDQTPRLLSHLPEVPGSAALINGLQSYLLSPYITTHLWFEHEFTDLHHAALLDSTYQWMFHKSRIRSAPAGAPSYIELVIGGSRDLLKADRAQLIDLARSDLALFFPESRSVPLLKSGVLKEARATFSVIPNLDAVRPHAQSPWPGLFFAGDWVATDWPSTMESAARGGYLAAEAFVASAGGRASFLQPDLPPTGFMKFFPG